MTLSDMKLIVRSIKGGEIVDIEIRSYHSIEFVTKKGTLRVRPDGDILTISCDDRLAVQPMGPNKIGVIL